MTTKTKNTRWDDVRGDPRGYSSRRFSRKPVEVAAAGAFHRQDEELRRLVAVQGVQSCFKRR